MLGNLLQGFSFFNCHNDTTILGRWAWSSLANGLWFPLSCYSDYWIIFKSPLITHQLLSCCRYSSSFVLTFVVIFPLFKQGILTIRGFCPRNGVCNVSLQAYKAQNDISKHHLYGQLCYQTHFQSFFFFLHPHLSKNETSTELFYLVYLYVICIQYLKTVWELKWTRILIFILARACRRDIY